MDVLELNAVMVQDVGRIHSVNPKSFPILSLTCAFVPRNYIDSLRRSLVWASITLPGLNGHRIHNWGIQISLCRKAFVWFPKRQQTLHQHFYLLLSWRASLFEVPYSFWDFRGTGNLSPEFQRVKCCPLNRSTSLVVISVASLQ